MLTSVEHTPEQVLFVDTYTNAAVISVTVPFVPFTVDDPFCDDRRKRPEIKKNNN